MNKHLDMLVRTAYLGYGDIAQMCQLPEEIVRKYRYFKDITHDHRELTQEEQDRLRTVSEVVCRRGTIWLHHKFDEDTHCTPLQLLSDGHYKLVDSMAPYGADHKAILDRELPGWRVKYFSSWYSFIASDGHTSIAEKSGKRIAATFARWAKEGVDSAPIGVGGSTHD